MIAKSDCEDFRRDLKAITEHLGNYDGISVYDKTQVRDVVMGPRHG